jgi:hypothetical protein
MENKFTQEQFQAALMENQELETQAKRHRWKKREPNNCTMSQHYNKYLKTENDIIVPKLIEAFRSQDFIFTKASQYVCIEDEKNGIITNIDLVLENTNEVMLVMLKKKPSGSDIFDHAVCVNQVYRYAKQNGDSREYLGAVAGIVIRKYAWDLIYNNGFYGIKPSGDIFDVFPPNAKAI